jgi:hypothetical protein
MIESLKSYLHIPERRGLNSYIYFMKNIFYVYIYFDPRNFGDFIYDELRFEYEPFYVGKGSGDRFKIHLYESVSKRSSPKLNKIRSILENNLQPIIIKLKDNLSENEAYELESKVICMIGRKDLEKGPLINLTDGGLFEKNKVWSKDDRAKISKSLKESQKFQNFVRSEDKSNRTSKSLKKYYEINEHHSKGVPKKSEQIEKIKNTMSIIYKILTPNDEILSIRGTKSVLEHFEKLNTNLELKGRFKISADAILYREGSKGYKLIEKYNEYRNMSCSDLTRQKFSLNNRIENNGNACEYEIKTPDGYILTFIGRTNVKKYFVENSIKISFDRLMNKYESNGYILICKRKINKLLGKDLNTS